MIHYGFQAEKATRLESISKDEGLSPNMLVLSMFVVCLSLNVIRRLHSECSLLLVIAAGASSNGGRLLLTNHVVS